MSFSLDLILRQIPPARVLADAGGHPIKETDGRFFTQCPCCQAAAEVLPRELICDNPLCSFKAGSGLDVLALLSGGFVQAAPVLCSRYPELLPTYSPEVVATEIMRQAAARRGVYSFLLRAAIEDQPAPVSHAQVYNWFRRSGIAPQQQRHSVFALTPNAYGELVSLLTPFDLKLPEVVSRDVGLLVGYGDYHTISTIWFFFWSGAGAPTINRCTVVPSRFSYFGLLDVPRKASILLSGDPVQALSNNSLLADITGTLAYVGVAVDVSCKTLRYLPASAAVHASLDDVSGWALPSKLAQEGVAIAVTHAADLMRCVDWPKFVADSLDSILHSTRGELTPRLDTALRVLQLPRKDLIAFADIVRTRYGERKASDILRRYSSVLVYEDETCEVYDRPAGYFLLKHKSSTEHRLTNFTVSIERLVTFKSATNTYYEGTLHVGGADFRVRFHPSDLESIGGIERAARLLEQPTPELPTVFDRTLAKHIPQTLRNASARIPQEEGQEGLGWLQDKDETFSGPGWRVGRGGFFDGALHLHPDVFWRKYYTQVSAVDARAATLPDSPLEKELLALFVGFAARSFFGLRCRPVFYPAQPHYTEGLCSFFRSIGQHILLSLSANQRPPDLTALKGFPILTITDKPQAFRETAHPLVILADLPEDGYNAGPSSCATNILNVIGQGLRTFLADPEFYRDTARYLDNRLLTISAGNKILQQVYPDVEWRIPPSAYPATEALLSHYTASTIGEVVAHDVLNQTVQLRAADKVGATDIVLELQHILPDIKLFPDEQTLEGSAGVLLPLLTNYFQEIPKIPVLGIDGPLKDIS